MKAGQRLAIVGPSGSGKSTLIGLMAGLDQPTSGEILIDGTDITRLGEDALARLRGRAIGFVFQFFHLVPSLTAFENVLVPMEIAGRRGAAERARALLDEVGLSGRGHHYPSQLSGGEQQRVAVARALSNEPAVIMADEPTGNLDSTNGQHVIDLLFDVHARRGTTLVLVTHDAALAARADVQLSLRDGRVVPPASVPSPALAPAPALGVARHGLRPAHGRPGAARGVAPPDLLLRLHRHRRRRHRRDPVDHRRGHRRARRARRGR